jgi:hypothetical protein
MARSGRKSDEKLLNLKKEVLDYLQGLMERNQSELVRRLSMHDILGHHTKMNEFRRRREACETLHRSKYTPDSSDGRDEREDLSIVYEFLKGCQYQYDDLLAKDQKLEQQLSNSQFVDMGSGEGQRQATLRASHGAKQDDLRMAGRRPSDLFHSAMSASGDGGEELPSLHSDRHLVDSLKPDTGRLFTTSDIHPAAAAASTSQSSDHKLEREYYIFIRRQILWQIFPWSLLDRESSGSFAYDFCLYQEPHEYSVDTAKARILSYLDSHRQNMTQAPDKRDYASLFDGIEYVLQFDPSRIDEIIGKILKVNERKLEQQYIKLLKNVGEQFKQHWESMLKTMVSDTSRIREDLKVTEAAAQHCGNPDIEDNASKILKSIQKLEKRIEEWQQQLELANNSRGIARRAKK